jgi:hypothetical protein
MMRAMPAQAVQPRVSGLIDLEKLNSQVMPGWMLSSDTPSGGSPGT